MDKTIFDTEHLTRNHSWDADYWLNSLDHIKSISDEKIKKIGMRKLRRIVFENNQTIVPNGFYKFNGCLKVELPNYYSFGKIYKTAIRLNRGDELPTKFTTKFEVVNCDCINAGKRLLDERFVPAVLNMACEDGPGGGVIGGCYGQEEGLFRRTNLYQYMYPFSPHATEYGLKPQYPQYPLNSVYDGVYVKNAIVFRREEAFGYALLRKPFPMSFIAVPALRDPTLQNGQLSTNDERLTLEKIKTILRIGLVNGHNALILGAWGCGIFHNPPLHIAKLFREVFIDHEFYNKFRRVTFAILEDKISLQRKNGIGNVQPFKTIFEDTSL